MARSTSRIPGSGEGTGAPRHRIHVPGCLDGHSSTSRTLDRRGLDGPLGSAEILWLERSRAQRDRATRLVTAATGELVDPPPRPDTLRYLPHRPPQSRAAMETRPSMRPLGSRDALVIDDGEPEHLIGGLTFATWPTSNQVERMSLDAKADRP